MAESSANVSAGRAIRRIVVRATTGAVWPPSCKRETARSTRNRRRCRSGRRRWQSRRCDETQDRAPASTRRSPGVEYVGPQAVSRATKATVAHAGHQRVKRKIWTAQQQCRVGGGLSCMMLGDQDEIGVDEPGQQPVTGDVDANGGSRMLADAAMRPRRQCEERRRASAQREHGVPFSARPGRWPTSSVTPTRHVLAARWVIPTANVSQKRRWHPAHSPRRRSDGHDHEQGRAPRAAALPNSASARPFPVQQGRRRARRAHHESRARASLDPSRCKKVLSL